MGQVHLGPQVLGVGADDHTLVVPVGDIGGIGHVLGAAFQGDVVVVGERGLGDLVQPVRLVAQVGERRVLGQVRNALLVGAQVFQHVHEVGVHEVHPLGEAGEGSVAVVGNVEVLAHLPVPGGDEDDAGGAARTVDGGRGGVLQDGDFLDGFRSDGLKGALDAVHQDERGVAALQGGDAAEHDGGGGGRVAVALGDVQAGHLALDELGGVADVTGEEVLALDRGDGGGDIALTLRAVADDDRIVQGQDIGFQGKVDPGAPLDGHFQGLEADGGHRDDGVRLDTRDPVRAVQVGHVARRGAGDQDARADNRLAGGLADRSGNGQVSLCGSGDGEQEQGARQDRRHCSRLE